MRTHRGAPWPVDLGRSLFVQGQVLRRSKRRREARAALEEAKAILDGHGYVLWRDRVDTELARAAPSRWRRP